MRTDDIVLHDATKSRMNIIKQQKPHACLLYSPEGTGKYQLALSLIEELIGPVKHEQNLLVVAPEGNSLTIESIRSIKQFLSLKYPDSVSGDIVRAVIIKDAHLMRAEAQNALLKTLEEPPSDTIIVLTASIVDALLPTILSRVVKVQILPLPMDTYKKIYPESSAQDISRLYHLSAGYYSLYSELMENKEHPFYQSIAEAKELLTSTTYDRLCKVSKLREDKESIVQIIRGLKQILQYTVYSKPQQKNIDRYAAAVQAEEDIAQNVHPKLVLTDLFLKL